jgi:hypothetical protein
MDQKTQTYNLWIFTYPVNAGTAKSAAKTILKEIENKIGVKVSCDIVPH